LVRSQFHCLGRTPLLRACAEGNFDAIRMLLLYSANPTAVDNEGETCLHHVVESDRPETFNCVEVCLVHFVSLSFVLVLFTDD
jgi:hypothetical protein